MNQEITDAFSQAFLESREAFGVSITLNGTLVQAVVSEAPFSRELVEGGFSSSMDIKVHYLASDLDEELKLGDSAEYMDKDFRVTEVSHQPGSKVAEVRLAPRTGR